MTPLSDLFIPHLIYQSENTFYSEQTQYTGKKIFRHLFVTYKRTTHYIYLKITNIIIIID